MSDSGAIIASDFWVKSLQGLKMLKQVPVDELQLGMYVASLDRPWAGTRFMFQGFEISTHEALEELRRCAAL